MVILLKILLVLFLVFLNGFFVASEFALVTVRRTRVSELVKKGRRRARLIQNAQENISRYISATQLGITLASLGLGWVGEPAIADTIRPLLRFIPGSMSEIAVHTIAIVLAFTLITFLHIVLGELTPKTIALNRAERTSQLIIVPLVFFTQIFWPVIWVLNTSGRIVLKRLGFAAPHAQQMVHSEEEIKLILDQSLKGGELEKEETTMLYNVLKLSDMRIKSIMKPRSQIIALKASTSVEDFNHNIKRYPHFSRFPVYKGTIDRIIGFVHVKDFHHISDLPPNVTLEKSGIIREILIISENKKADDVFLLMRAKRIHIAIIRDKDKKTEGVVTMENIIESLVGNIEDEFDQADDAIHKGV